MICFVKSTNVLEQWLILLSSLIECVSVSAFASLLGIPIGIASSAVGLKICVVTAKIKKLKSRIKNKWKKYKIILLWAKAKLNTIEVLISVALIDSNSSPDEFVSVINVLEECNDTKEEVKNPNI